MIQAGRLKDKVQFLRSIQTPNGSGGGTFAPGEYLDTFAEVIELKSNPDQIAEGIKVNQLVKITIRYRPDLQIVNGDMVNWRGFSLIVNNFVVDPRRTQIEIIAHIDAGNTKRSSV